MGFWNSFAEKHPSAAKWIREGGLFVIVITCIVNSINCIWVAVAGKYVSSAV